MASLIAPVPAVIQLPQVLEPRLNLCLLFLAFACLTTTKIQHLLLPARYVTIPVGNAVLAQAVIAKLA